MKHLRWTTLAGVLLSLSATSAQELPAEMRFWRLDGVSSFETHWNPEMEFGFADLILVWDKYDGSHIQGYRLGEAKSVEVVSPKLPLQCSVTQVKGILNFRDEGTSRVRFMVRGADCGAWIDALETTRLEARFTAVPRVLGNAVISSVLFRVLDLP